MSIRQMEFAIMVAKEKSFTIAAHKLKISQPSLSQSILNLEKDLGIQIFDRKNNLALTYAGEIYISKARAILSLQQNLKDEISELACNKKSLKISLSQIGYSLVYKKFLNFYSMFPKLNIKIIQLNSANVMKRAILNSYIDFGILTLPIDTGDIKYEIIKKEKMYLAVPINHTLSKNIEYLTDKYPKINLSSLKKEKFILPRDSLRSREILDKVFLEHNFKPNIFCEMEDLNIALSMVALGYGLCFTTKQFVTNEIKNKVKLFDINEPQLDKTLVLAYKKDKKLTKVFFELLKFIKT